MYQDESYIMAQGAEQNYARVAAFEPLDQNGMIVEENKREAMLSLHKQEL